MTLRWQEPPERASGVNPRTTALLEMFETLRANPGRWALVREGASEAWPPITLRNHGLADEIEFARRKRPDGKYDVYMRAVKAES
jgi:hypothetical protein